jgi:hypothetical protein
MMSPFALEVTAGDFAFAARYRLAAISLLAGTLNSRPLSAKSPPEYAATLVFFLRERHGARQNPRLAGA